MSLLALLGVSLAGFVGVSAVPGQDEPPPLRDCSTRAEPTHGRLRFATSGDVVVGPLSFTSLRDARLRANITDRKSGRWFRKSAVKLLYGNDVTLSVPEAYRSLLWLEYAPNGAPTSTVRFSPCPPGKLMFNGERYGRVTGFSGALVFSRLGCYPLEVRVDRGRTFRGTISLGAGRC